LLDKEKHSRPRRDKVKYVSLKIYV
jgi:hypothetical protein